MNDLHVVRIDSDDRLMTVADLADYLSVTTSWVYEARRSKSLPHFKLGNHLRFLKSDVDRWLEDTCRDAL